MGLYDRSYMRNDQNKTQGMSGRQMLICLIILNIAAFFIVHGKMFDALALTVGRDGFKISYLWQIFTAGFLHQGFSRILFNMWGLYIFGSLVAQHIDGKKMLILYLIGAVCGNLLFLLLTVNPAIPIRLVGASGAVCAMMAAAATLEPDRRFMVIFMPFTPIKTTTLVICYTIMEILFELSGRDSGVAHLAHLGGFAGGYLTMLILFGRRLPWDPFRAIFHRITGQSSYRRVQTPPPPPPKPQTQEKTFSDARVTQKELDDLLDKLSNHGINSLSEYELDRLRRARKQMRGEE